MKKGQTLKGEVEKLHGAPKQYQQGWTEFYKLKFKVTPDVLIPRPETELLVDEVLVHKPEFVMELGTGSGCIAVSVAKNLFSTKVIATDISEKALEIATQNAKFHRVGNQIIFIKSDLLNFLTDNSKAPDIIVANLPYIPTARLLFIDPMVTEFEPKIALDGGQDGFQLYRRLFTQIKQKNFYPKYLITEVDEKQGELALAEAQRFFPKAKMRVKKDFYKADRILLVAY